MKKLNRRNFVKLAAASGTAMATGLGTSQSALAGTVKLKEGGQGFSPVTNKERQAIPSACWQCVTRDAMMGFVEDGRLVKLEGHPDSIRTSGSAVPWTTNVGAVMRASSGTRLPLATIAAIWRATPAGW